MTANPPPQKKPLLTLEEVEAIAENLASIKQAGLQIVATLRDREGVDQRWLSIGQTDFEKGLVFIGKELVEGTMNHAIAQEGD